MEEGFDTHMLPTLCVGKADLCGGTWTCTSSCVDITPHTDNDSSAHNSTNTHV